MKLSRWQEYGTLHSKYNTATQLKEIPILSPQFILEPQVQENSRIFLGDVSNLVIHLVEYTQQLLSAYCQHIRG